MIQVSMYSYASLKPYISIGHILMMKVKDVMIQLKRKKSRVYHRMEYWYGVYHIQF